MANIRSQIKRNRQNERRRLRNKSVRSELRTRTKAAAKGVIHKNQAANRKSRLMRRINAIEASSAE